MIFAIFQPDSGLSPFASRFDMAAKRHKKHKNKILGSLISMGYYK
jgi:hypothetical protein